jgi:16S rRNA (adenine1518-N6/adenine1519-N6)-dimethyltransferase
MVRLPDVFCCLVVMLQREVAERICAAPGNKTYGALSVEVQARARADVVLRVKPGSFHPPPKVDSAVIRLDLGRPEATRGVDLGVLDRLARASFGQRRKTLRRSLGSMMGRDAAIAMLERAGVDPGARPEQLALVDFANMANEYEDGA